MAWSIGISSQADTLNGHVDKNEASTPTEINERQLEGATTNENDDWQGCCYVNRNGRVTSVKDAPEDSLRKGDTILYIDKQPFSFYNWLVIAQHHRCILTLRRKTGEIEEVPYVRLTKLTWKN